MEYDPFDRNFEGAATMKVKKITITSNDGDRAEAAEENIFMLRSQYPEQSREDFLALFPVGAQVQHETQS
jgi:hypothetical protein